MPISEATLPATAAQALIEAARRAHPGIEVRAPGPDTVRYAHDASRRGPVDGTTGPAVALPGSVAEVQTLVRLTAEYGIPVVPRGAGTGLSGGADATADHLVISTERLARILEISVDDELAVVEPGVLNAELNRALLGHGLFYAPDPASHDISTIGGNIATNAGGLHCAKYGVTRESVLALDVVLADGELISVGHRSIKGVAGLDLASLFVGSEGILGIVVAATLRLHPLPVARRTLAVFFDDTPTGVRALGAIRRTPVRPAAVEFLDTGTLDAIDAHSGTALRERGAALALIELDGYGVDEQTEDLRAAFEVAGGRLSIESEDAAAELWNLRRSGRGIPADAWFLGGDMAVPVSRLPEIYAALPEVAARYGVDVSAVAHAGDGNLHPVITRPVPAGGDPSTPAPELHDAMEDLVRLALALGGTATGEHGLGSLKRSFAELELSPRNLAAQHAVKAALDPLGVLNPGTAI